ncbi:hypothetical protein [Pseudomonas syringae]|uniref:hypothetical protein n=1 Tax=Pseudomonas syringae TaxID=317 RepID=UPI0034D7790A
MAATDSYRTDRQSFVDLITRFADNNDKIDVPALGYTGFGGGKGTTLKTVYNHDLDRTYLKDVEADAQGQRFEIGLTGDWTQDLGNADMIFASKVQVSLVGGSWRAHRLNRNAVAGNYSWSTKPKTIHIGFFKACLARVRQCSPLS